MSAFDPENFLNQQTEDALDTQIIPVPEGEWEAQIEDIKPTSGTSQKSGNPFYILQVTWNILDQKVSETTQRDKNTVRQSVFLDVKDDGSLDRGKGKNVNLGRLREAVGQNKPGKKWKPADLVGQTATIQVVHKHNEETGNPIAEVKRVSKSS